MNMHINEAKRILVSNDRGGYTVPTDRLYPFQWNWDSAFSTIPTAPIVNLSGLSKANGRMG